MKRWWRGVVAVLLVLVSVSAAGAAWDIGTFFQELEKLEKTRDACLPEEQAVRAAQAFHGCTAQDINALRALQWPKNQMPAVFGPTRPMTRAECVRYPERSWARVIGEAALGLRDTAPEVAPPPPVPDDRPKYWPKSNIPTQMPPRPPKPEPPAGPPPAGTSVYWLLCAERANLYWFATDGRLGRLFAEGPFRMPHAMCYGPDGNILVLDMPVYTAQPAILWSVSPAGQALALAQWPRNDPNVPLDRPTQILWHNRMLLVSDQIKGLLVWRPGKQLRQVMKPLEHTRRYGGLAFEPGGRLLIAHGFDSRMTGVFPNLVPVPVPAQILALDFAAGTAAELANDAQGALWMPRSMAIAGGVLWIADEGMRAKNETTYTGGSPGRAQQTRAHSDGGLQKVRGGRIEFVPVAVGGRVLRHPWGLTLDGDGSLLVASPAMTDPSGRIHGAVVRYTPGVGGTYLFQGRDTFQPLWVLPIQRRP